MFRWRRVAHALGIGMVYQHSRLVPSMTVGESRLLARADLPMVIDRGAEGRRMQEFVKDMPFKVDLTAPVSALAAGEKQKVEILKQLYLDCRILILDEPTSVLTPGEADEILGLLHDMTTAGRLSVLMITHKLREVMAFADEVTVLRRGRLAGRGKVEKLTPRDLAEMMIGSSEIAAPAERAVQTNGRERLRLERLCADNDKGHRAVSNVSLFVRAGEIVGIAGVSGNGQTELVEVLAGQRESSAGTVTVHGEPYTATRAEMRRHKVFCLSEDPLRNACVSRMSVAENLAYRRFDEPPLTLGRWFLNRGAMRRAASDLITRYRITVSSPDAPAGTLSGGNVQRMVLARELSGEVDVLIAANPCFGLDIAAVAEIRAQIMRARNRGAAILLVSEDLDEQFEQRLVDRIVHVSYPIGPGHRPPQLFRDDVAVATFRVHAVQPLEDLLGGIPRRRTDGALFLNPEEQTIEEGFRIALDRRFSSREPTRRRRGDAPAVGTQNGFGLDVLGTEGACHSVLVRLFVPFRARPHRQHDRTDADQRHADERGRPGTIVRRPIPAREHVQDPGKG